MDGLISGWVYKLELQYSTLTEKKQRQKLFFTQQRNLAEILLGNFILA